MDFSRYFDTTWYQKLKHYVESKEFEDIAFQIAYERKDKKIYPEKDSELFLKVFRIVPYDKVRVVIVGQDIYHDDSYDGLAFSNSDDKLTTSPSLRNILKEVEEDVYDGFALHLRESHSLYKWAEQGVFLINTSHTVIKGKPGSHLHYWKDFTENVFKSLNDKDCIIWMLWGNEAKKYEDLITNPTHTILKAGHPASECYGHKGLFLGNRHFSKVNEILVKNYLIPIVW